MSINVHVSDLFFNSQHDYNHKVDRWNGYYNLHEEAALFLASLSALYPPARVIKAVDLCENFIERL